jgi:hypothetical protein
MPFVHALAAGGIAGVLANVSGYALTGRLFHPFQSKTPNTWRATESGSHYVYAAAVRIGACVGVALLYAAAGAAVPSLGAGPLARGLSFGAILWAVTILPVLVEAAFFVNWHRGFVAGLLLDWLVACLLAGAAAALAVGAG